MKKDLKILFGILFVIIVIAFVMIFVAGFAFSNFSHTYKGVDKIEKHYAFDSDILDEVGDYDDAYYQLYHQNIWVFQSDASVLILNYTPDNYEAQK